MERMSREKPANATITVIRVSNAEFEPSADQRSATESGSFESEGSGSADRLTSENGRAKGID
jgi:hypothetical protein